MNRGGKILSILCAAPFLLALLILLWPKKPVPASLDSDLQHTRRTVPAAQNGYAALQKAADALKLNYNDELDLTAHMAGTKWDTNAVAHLLAINRPALALWEQAMTAGDLQVPAPRSNAEEYLYLGAWRKIAQLELLEAAQMEREGRGAEALERAMRVIEFGRRIQHADGTMSHYSVGSGIKRLACERLRQFTQSAAVTPIQLPPLIAKLAGYRASGSVFTNTLKLEYQLILRGIQLQLGSKPTNSVLENMGLKMTSKIFYDDAKTRQNLSGATRTCLRSIPLTYDRMPISSLSAPRNLSFASMVMSGNVAGEMFADIMTPSWPGFLSSKCRENSTIAATQAVLALQCYKADHGEYPAQLDALVPRYLPALPLDDFDGLPLRYLRDKKILYSIDRDLIDSGGLRSTNGTTADLVFDLEPKP
jgi:hypothetical protein